MKNWLNYIVQNSKWDFVRYINNLTNNYKIFGVVEWEQLMIIFINIQNMVNF